MLAAIRTPFTYFVGLFATGVAATAVIGTSLLAPTSPVIDHIVAAWARTILWSGGVRVKVIGLENVDPSASYVVASNHQSTFDIMAHFVALPVSIRFLAKKELFGVPLLGWALKRLHMVPVDRSAGITVYEKIEQNAAATIADGKSIIVYPEGTRTTTGELLPFKKGAFFIAVRTGLPILPTTIAGSYEAWLPRAKIIRGGTITVAIGNPIPTHSLTVDGAPGLRDAVRSTIEATLVELRAKSTG